jgi:L-ascorbate metabolism protein UlaG (beta-lactamase superfamily)
MMADVYGAPDLIEAIESKRVPAGAVTLWWLGQATYAIKIGNAVTYVDPYLRVSDRRLSPPPFAPAAVTNADIVLLTHDHGDHVDPETLPGIAAASPQARFICPRPIVDRVAALVGDRRRVIGAGVDEPIEATVAGLDLEFLPVPAKHEEFDLTPVGYPYLGYSIRTEGLCVHHTGDTIPFEGQVERLKEHAIDLLLVPINGRDFYRTRSKIIGNFDAREAAEFTIQVGAEVVIPMHYGMFRGNTVPPGNFVTYLHDYHPTQSTHVMGRFAAFTYIPTRRP